MKKLGMFFLIIVFCAVIIPEYIVADEESDAARDLLFEFMRVAERLTARVKGDADEPFEPEDEWLVDNQNARLVDQCLCDTQTPTHSA